MGPDELSQHHELPLQRALIDFDINPHELQVIGADPMDLSDLELEPVKSLITTWAVITIVAHRNEGRTRPTCSKPDPT